MYRRPACSNCRSQRNQGIVYSYPVICAKGKYQIVQGLSIDDFSRKMMDATAAELWEEREQAFAFLRQ